MKKLLLLCCLLPLFTTAQKCVLKGHISGLDTGEITFMHTDAINDEAHNIQKVKVRKGNFTYTAQLGGPTYYSIYYHRRKTDKQQYLHKEIDVFLENGKMSLNGELMKLNEAAVKGSAVNDEWRAINNAISHTEDSLFKPYNEDSIPEAVEKLAEQQTKEQRKQYILSHTQSPVSLQLLIDQYKYDMKPAEAEPLYNAISKELRETASGVSFGKKLAVAQRTDIGKPIIDVKLPDTAGVAVSLSSFKGHVTLLDFWASWCGPCRQENPNVVKAYQKYHDKGFEIYAVSLDTKRESWIAAIKKDGLTWTHVSDLKGWEAGPAADYGVRAIPSNVLIDKEGKVLAKNLRSEDLQRTLEQLFP